MAAGHRGSGDGMANRKGTFREMCEGLRDQAVETLFEKARVANGVAKVAFAGGRRIAYTVKHRCFARSLELAPLLFRHRSDWVCQRLIVAGRFGALHWKRLDEAV